MNFVPLDQSTKFTNFILATEFSSLKPDTVKQAKLLIRDLICVAIAGSKTPLSKIIHDHAVEHYAAGKAKARLLFDGRFVSPTGAALAGGMTIDSIDAHDGQKLTKGHVGCALLPSLLAMAEAEGLKDGGEFLTRIIIGYEIGSRAGIALHASVPDYHTSGAWMAVACAALGARSLKLDDAGLRHAIGIGEYHGPRSQMMRLIDHPSMLKDGSGFGAMAGTSAAYLAEAGFTGAPAISVESPETAQYWNDLGDKWYIFDQYIKPWPVCRWAQPAAQAALSLVDKHDIRSEQIEHVEVTTFHEGIRLASRLPQSTEEAQYSLPWPVAAGITRRKIGVEEISQNAFKDAEIIRLSKSMKLHESDDYNERFPAKRIAHISLHLKDGTVLTSQPTEARGDPECPFSETEMREKFDGFAAPVIGPEKAAIIVKTVELLEQDGNFTKLADLLSEPIH